MKKLFVSLFILVFIVVIAGVGALYYAKPDQSLNLAYEKVPLKDRAIDMVKRRSPDLLLTSEDLNNLAKKSVADNPQVEKDVVVTGADFVLQGDLLTADLNVIWKDKVSAGIQITYRLTWNEPNVVAKVEKAKMKGITLPKSMFSDRVIPIAEDLPKLLKIKDLQWEGSDVRVIFQKPSLKDLQQLIVG
ncbi:hypothetical protein [Cohnella mopanensis]|uniref:hypothetical protein n=1 Tax=Cohnella mopanensis TaxID=2911966 RepID=UPI001EF801E6|nr:hypothetical protein [Cohnella mopanensis]